MDISNKNCNCINNEQNNTLSTDKQNHNKKNKIIPSIILSFFIAFFPKCPLCWAAYMSMFGVIGITNIPYMGWLLPILFVFLVIQHYILFKKSKNSGYLPFFISILGTIIMLIGKIYFSENRWVVFLGMGLVIGSTLLLNIPKNYLYAFKLKSNN